MQSFARGIIRWSRTTYENQFTPHPAVNRSSRSGLARGEPRATSRSLTRPASVSSSEVRTSQIPAALRSSEDQAPANPGGIGGPQPASISTSRANLCRFALLVPRCLITTRRGQRSAISTRLGRKRAMMASMVTASPRRACSPRLPNWSAPTARTRWRNIWKAFHPASATANTPWPGQRSSLAPHQAALLSFGASRLTFRRRMKNENIA